MTVHVLFVAAEVSPFAKVGGLADVAAALPSALAELGAQVTVVMPRYGSIDSAAGPTDRVGQFRVPVGGRDEPCAVWRGTLPRSAVTVLFLENSGYFDRSGIYGDENGEYPDALERFVFLSRAAACLGDALGFEIDVVHANDWHTALVPLYLAQDLGARRPGSLLTIHNLAYQGVFSWDQVPGTGLPEEASRCLEKDGTMNLLKGGIHVADLLATVSPTYAREILEYGEGLEAALREREGALRGVLNGIDTAVWDPSADPRLWAPYRADDLSGKAENKRRLQETLGLAVDPSTPLVGVISRLVEQKGMDLLLAGWEELMAMGVQFVLLGAGDPRYEDAFRDAAGEYPGRAASLVTFSEDWAHRIEAGADLFLMPSRFEPCGLNQMYSLRYGTVPVVRAIGGLRDTVRALDPASDTGNGFLFEGYTAEEMLGALRRAIDVYHSDPGAWHRLRVRGMLEDHSWHASARAYLTLYEGLAQRR